MTAAAYSREPLLRISPQTGSAPSAAPAKILAPPRVDMLARDNFVFTIGYDGPSAVIDSQAKKRYGALGTRELVEKGLFRAAYSSAVYSKDPAELALVAEAYGRLTGTAVEASSLGRLFGVILVDVKRSVVL
jgi:hypothetical protein